MANANAAALSDDEIAIFNDKRKARDELTVRYWAVCRDERMQNGGTLFTSALTPYFKTKAQAAEAIESIKTDYPDAFIGKWEVYFSPLRPGDMRSRAAVLAQLA